MYCFQFVLDWERELEITLSVEEERFPDLFSAFHNWREAAIASWWEREDAWGERSIFNEISNDELMPTELNIGFKKRQIHANSPNP